MKNTKMMAFNAAISVALVAGVFAWGQNTVQASRHQQQADKYLEQRNFSAAAGEFQQALRIKPDPDTHFVLGVTLARAGRRDEAMQTLRDAAQGQTKAAVAAKRMLDRMKREPRFMPQR